VTDIKILLASQNEHKIKEFRAIFKDTDISLITLKDLNDQDEVEETELTFVKNALIKAKYFSKKYHIPAISDDSGICVNALGGKPGVHSKRYANGNDYDNNIKLLNALKDVKDRRAYFFAAIVIYFPDCTYKVYEGEVHGTIGYEIKKIDAFGYDSVFYPDGYDQTFSEIDPTIKNKISHRGQALKKVKEDLFEIINHK
jgi:XTP/dITP diphosphohydrolase